MATRLAESVEPVENIIKDITRGEFAEARLNVGGGL
jgi:hypothetical protein